MTKDVAIHNFFSRFMTFYAATSVSDDVVFPYGTYDLVIGSFDDGEVSLTVNLWFFTESERIPSEAAQNILDEIGRDGVRLPCDGGYVWIKRGPVQSLPDETNDKIKRRYMNLTAEFLTLN